MQEEEERKREAELRIGWSSSMSLMSNKKRIQRCFDKGFGPYEGHRDCHFIAIW